MEGKTSRRTLCPKSTCVLISLRNLCVLCVSVVNDLRPKFTTETQRTQRLRRDISTQVLFRAKRPPFKLLLLLRLGFFQFGVYAVVVGFVDRSVGIVVLLAQRACFFVELFSQV